MRTSKAAILAGYRSGLEIKIAEQIRKQGLQVVYEDTVLNYTIPERIAKYRPDFRLPKKDGYFLIETKGLWNVKDRAKARFCHEQIPDLDLRYVFSNWNQKLYKNSPTSYRDYCERLGWKCANKVIPDEWLLEAKE